MFSFARFWMFVLQGGLRVAQSVKNLSFLLNRLFHDEKKAASLVGYRTTI